MKRSFTVKGQDLEDVRSALSFFISNYEKATGDKAPQTIRAMKRLLKKAWGK